MSDWPSAYQEHAPGIRAYLRRRVRHAETAEDLCQETFTRAMRADGALREATKLRSYLYRTAHNLMLNHLRRPAVVQAEADLGEDLELDAFAHPRAEDPASEVTMRELGGRVRELLDQLPPDQREAFVEGVLHRVPYAEIAARTGWSVAKVKVDVYRARRRLIDGLREFREESP